LPHFKAGQWIDLFLPGIQKPGGFTITSAPPPLTSSLTSISIPVATDLKKLEEGEGEDYLELAIQKSPQNPAAAWLWRDEKEVLGQRVKVRVGGSFVWPPPGFDGSLKGLKRVVFIAGGVGINPFMSMLSYIARIKEEKGREVGSKEGRLRFQVVLLYSSKDVSDKEGEVLFEERLRRVFRVLGKEGEMTLFLTGEDKGDDEGRGKVERRRIEKKNLLDVLGDVEEREGTVCYICGVPSMTDEFVELLKKVKGMRPENVLCERWW